MLLIAYLAAVALQPAILDVLPSWLSWFGRPGRWRPSRSWCRF
ncbi:hypothetical protein BZL30_6476 [Mycobacterium kansasii]|uniref:Uncharacterized protein n=1 Tax=Mycobacterium kansasii TaxID=1768 RepID=A0A1V3WUA4_MYCKA|nr:hypothetical protein BZL30_6476 [Mycobacterium kansasii]